MPVTFRILPEHGLCLVRYQGRAVVREGFEAFGHYLQHPDYRPGQRQLVDLSGVTEIEHDFPELFRFQAEKAAAIMVGGKPAMMVYLAPTRVSLRMARQIQRSWEGLDGAAVRIAQDFDAACTILGLRRDTLEGIMADEA